MNILVLVKKINSNEGSTKYLWRLHEGELIESVLLEHENMTCLCISSQVGCPLDCIYCATGQLNFRRNLTTKEIIEQVSKLKNELFRVKKNNLRSCRVLFMGMGEPLLNYISVVESAISIHNAVFDYPMEVFLATSGISVDKISQLAVDAPFIQLWITLCATDNGIRAKLKPKASINTIEDILGAGEAYAEKVGRPTRINYLMIRGLTDTTECAKELGKLLAKKPFKLQLSRLNPVPNSSLEGSSIDNIRKFADLTTQSGVPTSLFISKGINVMAGCGQLYASTE